MSQSATATLRSAVRAAVTGRDARELDAWFAPHLDGLQVERVSCGDVGMVIEAQSSAAGATCPACGAGPRGSTAATPGNWRMVRRAAVTFAEQAEGLSARYRRRSVPLLT